MSLAVWLSNLVEKEFVYWPLESSCQKVIKQNGIVNLWEDTNMPVIQKAAVHIVVQDVVTDLLAIHANLVSDANIQ